MKKNKKKIAIIFSGQKFYSYKKIVNLSKKYLEIPKMFKKANIYLKINIWKKIKFKNSKLKKNKYLQLINLIINLSLYKQWKKKNKKNKKYYPYIFTGHSLGQYAALVASKIIKTSDAFKIVFFRGKLLQKQKGSMYAIFNTKKSKIYNLFKKKKVSKFASIASINSKKQIVISIKKNFEKKILLLLKKQNIKKIFKLFLNHPFHSKLMKKFSKKFFKFIKNIKFKKSKFNFLESNTVKIIKNSKKIKNLLKKHIYTPVLWKKTIQFIKKLKIKKILEIGTNKILLKF